MSHARDAIMVPNVAWADGVTLVAHHNMISLEPIVGLTIDMAVVPASHALQVDSVNNAHWLVSGAHHAVLLVTSCRSA